MIWPNPNPYCVICGRTNSAQMYYDEEGRMYGYYCALCQEKVFKVPRGQESKNDEVTRLPH